MTAQSRVVAFSTIVLFCLLAPAIDARSKSACALKRVYIAGMGASDDAKQFIFLLEPELTRRGFQLVPNADKAEAVLSGVVTVKDDVGGPPESINTNTAAYVTAKLVDKNGTEIWRGYFKPSHGIPSPFKTPLEVRAEQLAKDLENSCREGWAKK